MAVRFRLVWLRLKRVLTFLAGSASAGVGVAAAVGPRPEMPSAGFAVGLWILIVAMIAIGTRLIWVSVRAPDHDIHEMTF